MKLINHTIYVLLEKGQAILYHFLFLFYFTVFLCDLSLLCLKFASVATGIKMLKFFNDVINRIGIGIKQRVRNIKCRHMSDNHLLKSLLREAVPDEITDILHIKVFFGMGIVEII